MIYHMGLNDLPGEIKCIATHALHPQMTNTFEILDSIIVMLMC